MYIIVLISFLSLSYLSPTGFIGFWILFLGLIFTGIMLDFVLFRLNTDNYSSKDNIRKGFEEERQKKRIAKLYPKNEIRSKK